VTCWSKKHLEILPLHVIHSSHTDATGPSVFTREVNFRRFFQQSWLVPAFGLECLLVGPQQQRNIIIKEQWLHIHFSFFIVISTDLVRAWLKHCHQCQWNLRLVLVLKIKTCWKTCTSASTTMASCRTQHQVLLQKAATPHSLDF